MVTKAFVLVFKGKPKTSSLDLLVKAARSIECEVYMVYGDREANMKSLLELLLLDLSLESSVVIKASGKGAYAAISILKLLINQEYQTKVN